MLRRRRRLMSEERDYMEGVQAFARQRHVVLALLFAAAGLALYLAGVPGNPPGFFVDESSIAYNAHLVAATGADEHGESFPLFFRAFGEYKSPVYVYLLAALFKLVGPSVAAARALSAVLGAVAALVIGLLAARVERADGGDASASRAAGLGVAFSALLTPWLFEVSRLVFEVALLPLALALLLLAVRRADERDGVWTRGDSLRVALGLALVTYTYSVGRMLAPLLALGLVFFAPRGGWWRAAARTWLFYAASLAPLVAFTLANPGALGERFAQVSFIRPEMTWGEIVARFAQNYAGSFSPWSWLVAGDPEPRHHLAVMGSVLLPTVLLAALGVVLMLRTRRGSAWWRFVLYGLAVSAVPSSFTQDHFHTLRLMALPVFLLLLAAPALGWLARRDAPRTSARRAALLALLALTAAQGLAFQFLFHRAAGQRFHNFDAFYPEIFDAAVARPERPIRLIDLPGAPGYMHAYWYAALRGMGTGEFVRLPREERPPPGALVISTEVPCTDCRVLLQRGGFRVYLAGRVME
jgi:4-amino-4-deoxy-L-arabinose transferase-like glycosyltransferase